MCLLDHELISEFCIFVDLTLRRSIRVIVDAVSRVLDCEYVDLQRSAHVVKHLVRYADVLCVTVEKDYQLSAAFQVGQE